MPARRSHTKSRTGCVACKKRHIKCDESKPKCSNCIAHDETSCTYIVKSSSSKADQKGSDGRQSAKPKSTGLGEQQLDGTSATGSASPPLSINDLELLHHWSTTTYAVLGETPEKCHVLQIIIPQVGVKHPYVMHGLLAFTALHFSHCHPSQHHENVVKAIAHQNAALAEFKEDLRRVDENNFEAVFAFSCVLCGYSYALPSYKQLSANEIISSVLQSLSLLRSIRIILGPWIPKLMTTRFQPLFPIEHMIAAIGNEDFGTPPPGLYDLAKVDEPEQALLLKTSIDELMRQFAKFLRDGERMASTVILVWLTTTSDAFIGLLQQRQPNALAILAYFGALVHQNVDEWPLHEYGVHIVRSVSELLGPVRETLISWPERVISLQRDDSMPEEPLD